MEFYSYYLNLFLRKCLRKWNYFFVAFITTCFLSNVMIFNCFVLETLLLLTVHVHVDLIVKIVKPVFIVTNKILYHLNNYRLISTTKIHNMQTMLNTSKLQIWEQLFLKHLQYKTNYILMTFVIDSCKYKIFLISFSRFI